MIRAKQFLLGSAAALATVTGANAADLPMTKAEPVEYVKVCSEFGTGYFYIPGSDTCLQLGGYVRSDFYYVEPKKRSDNASQWQGRAQVRWDARTATEYGTLRSYIAIDADYGAAWASTSNSSFKVHYAYLQFGGVTAGFIESAFNFYDGKYGSPIYATYGGEQGRKNILSYTGQFGGGLSATLSVEDSIEHNTSIAGFGGLTDKDDAARTGYGGSRMPDFVANVAYDGGKGGWGKAQVMGAVHQVRGVLDDYSSKYGYAVGAALQMNIPFAAGGYFVIEGEYADGASGYTGANKFQKAPDAYAGPGPGFAFETAKSWSIEGEAGFNLTPSLLAIAFGSYRNFDAPSIIADKGNDYTAWVAGGQLVYTVVKGMTVAGEVSYQSIDVTGKSTVDTWAGAMRVRRSF
ncbi:porin [Labrys wisconsinensis]|uniref:Porin n=1 Tax=Labrys wisconsinensis TaxID=425677 RepID=A0ABU0IZF5_9HYPH|nr:porin [Labrys wisconsinensis]MDQ0467396.1 hypothetical protein [Labrys wisconsinensis]